MAGAFNGEDGHAFGSENRSALEDLLARPDWGSVFVVESGHCTIGYAVVCYGYSIEFGGRDAILDEWFIEPAERGAGCGSAVLAQLEAFCRAEGIVALHLEVMDTNARAQMLYDRMGYPARKSRLRSKAL